MSTAEIVAKSSVSCVVPLIAASSDMYHNSINLHKTTTPRLHSDILPEVSMAYNIHNIL